MKLTDKRRKYCTYNVRYEMVTVVAMKSTILRVVTPYDLEEDNTLFR
jgi:hypothetical protein